jgi:hypothetical protein
MEHRGSRKTAKAAKPAGSVLASKPILNRYLQECRKLLSAKSVEDRSVTISFPFHLAANHRIEITATKIGKQQYILSDAARTLGEVQDAGHTITRGMMARIERISGAAGISIRDGHLLMETSAKNLAASIQRYLETAKTIGDVYLIHKSRIEPDGRLVSEIRRALDSTHMLYREKEKLRGQIEVHSFDLLVPPNGHPGLAIGVVSGQNTRALATNWYYRCDDIKLAKDNRNVRLALIYDVAGGIWSDASKRILAIKADAAIPSNSPGELPGRFQDLVKNVS